MRRYNVEIEVSYGGGYYDGDEYHDLVTKESPTGIWYRAIEVDKLLKKNDDKFKRMQKRIDKLEGRA